MAKQEKGLQKVERGVRVADKGLGTEAERSAELAQAAAASAEKTFIESAYVMAIKFPRDEAFAEERINNICQDYDFAIRALYKKPVSSKKNEKGEWEKVCVEGLSIRFAEEMIRLWGNVWLKTGVKSDDAHRRVVNITVTDLEARLVAQEDILVEKKVERRNSKDRQIIDERVNSNGDRVFVVVATEDEVLIKQKALESKARRDLILDLIPASIRARVQALILETIKAGIKKNPQAAKKTIVEVFAELKITVQQLEKYLGCEIFKATPEQIADLRSVWTAIKDGQAKWEDFENKKTKPGKSQNSDDDVLDGLNPGK